MFLHAIKIPAPQQGDYPDHQDLAEIPEFLL